VHEIQDAYEFDINHTAGIVLVVMFGLFTFPQRNAMSYFRRRRTNDYDTLLTKAPLI